ncbi:MAG: energy-coupling factor ABC transporter permease, partial [Euryarchaeota archaeon]|nr:energy-coupling factor ABC transporter permease [Euryarchaeota archaeon]
MGLYFLLKNHGDHRGHREKRRCSVLSVHSVVDQLCSDSFFQAFVAHGGLTTLDANTFSMGIVGAFGGYLVYRLLKNVSPLWFSAGMAGLCGSILTYLATALQLALSLNPDNVMYYWELYSLGFIPTQFPLAAAEFA